MRRMIVIAFFQQLAVLSSEFIQLHGLLHLFLLYRKRNIDLLVTHFARKRNLIVKKCKELKLHISFEITKRAKKFVHHSNCPLKFCGRHVYMRLKPLRMSIVLPAVLSLA